MNDPKADCGNCWWWWQPIAGQRHLKDECENCDYQGDIDHFTMLSIPFPDLEDDPVQ